MHMYNFLCSDSLLYFFLFLSTLHSVYTRDCSYEMYRNFIPCACNLCIHLCFVGFGDVIFVVAKNVLFSGGKVVRKFGAKSSKKS